jgi:hypothetical protein
LPMREDEGFESRSTKCEAGSRDFSAEKYL